MGQFGIENLKKAAKLGIELGEQTSEVLEDGKLKALEMLSFIDELMQLPGIVNSAADIKNEVLELDAEDRASLNAYIQAEFDIPNEKLESIIEAGLDVIISLFILADHFKRKHNGNNNKSTGRTGKNPVVEIMDVMG